MGYDGEGADKEGSNGAGMSNDLQCSGLGGANLRERELGSDKGNAESARGVPPSGCPEDSRDVVSASRGGEIGVVIGGRGLGVSGSVANEGVYLEFTGYHCVIHRDSPHH